jgi:hypothetical protein
VTTVNQKKPDGPPARGKRIIVCGGRDYAEAEVVFRVLLTIHLSRRSDVGSSSKYPLVGPIEFVIHGACGWDGDRPSTWTVDNLRGADRHADLWAWRNNVGRSHFPAHWTSKGKSAGPLRNAKMLDDRAPHAVVAFPGGRGTESMVKLAVAKGVPVLRVNLVRPWYAGVLLDGLGEWILPAADGKSEAASCNDEGGTP